MRQTPFYYFLDSSVAPIGSTLLVFFALSTTGLSWLAAIVPGWLAWTLVEYLIHRYAYHRVAFFEGLHDAHHREPRALIGAPPGLGTLLILTVVLLPLLFLGKAMALGGTIGFLLGYTGYQTVHHAIHFWTTKRGGLLYKLRLHHMRHHAQKEWNFGVSVPLWDYLFGTLFVPISPSQTPARRAKQSITVQL